jgi:hypothetical protein
VGNGQLAFTADVTGLQTFPEAYEQTIPLGTLSDWGWHTAPNPQGWSIDRFRFTEFTSHGRLVGYADIPGDTRTPEVQWLRGNPHRLHLGRLGLDLTTRDGRKAIPADLTGIEQTLDLWNGELVSRFVFDGQPVEVRTTCHPGLDAIAVRVASPLIRRGQLRLVLAFPYGTGQATAADWNQPDAHLTQMQADRNSATFARRLDADRYHVAVGWNPAGSIARTGPHTFTVAPATLAPAFELVMAFSAAPARAAPPTVADTRQAAQSHWNGFWQTGGAIDLSGSRDPRWRELERRIVLSQYLTAIQCAGRTPPQETVLPSTAGRASSTSRCTSGMREVQLWNRLPLFEQPRLLLENFPQLNPPRRARLRGRPMAQDDGPSAPSPRRPSARSHLAAAASGSRRNCLPRQAERGDLDGGERSCSRLRRSWPRSRRGTRMPGASCSARAA